jgi:RNA-binding protein
MTGAQKARLRGIGQRLDATLKVGKEGLTPSLLVELRRQLTAHELVKIRFLGSDRHQRSALCQDIEGKTSSVCIGSVGQTALFHVPVPDEAAG